MALFVALGGPATAADGAARIAATIKGSDIRPNTIGSREIRDSAITSAEIKNLSVDTSDLAPNSVLTSRIAPGAITPTKLFSGTAAANLWGRDQWAPPSATQRGYLEIRNDGATNPAAGLSSISFPAPLAPGAKLSPVAIGEGRPLPPGCGGSIAAPEAVPGRLCIFYRAFTPGSVVSVKVRAPELLRFGVTLYVGGSETSESSAASALVTWAMTAPAQS